MPGNVGPLDDPPRNGDRVAGVNGRRANESRVSAPAESRHPNGTAVVVEEKLLDVLVGDEGGLDPGTETLGGGGQEACDALRQALALAGLFAAEGEGPDQMMVWMGVGKANRNLADGHERLPESVVGVCIPTCACRLVSCWGVSGASRDGQISAAVGVGARRSESRCRSSHLGRRPSRG